MYIVVESLHGYQFSDQELHEAFNYGLRQGEVLLRAESIHESHDFYIFHRKIKSSKWEFDKWQMFCLHKTNGRLLISALASAVLGAPFSLQQIRDKLELDEKGGVWECYVDKKRSIREKRPYRLIQVRLRALIDPLGEGRISQQFSLPYKPPEK